MSAFERSVAAMAARLAPLSAGEMAGRTIRRQSSQEIAQPTASRVPSPQPHQGGYVISEPDALLDAWRDGYGPPAGKRMSFYADPCTQLVSGGRASSSSCRAPERTSRLCVVLGSALAGTLWPHRPAVFLCKRRALERERFIAAMPWDYAIYQGENGKWNANIFVAFHRETGPSGVLASSPCWSTEDGTLPARLRSVFPGARHESAGFAGKHVQSFSQVPGTSFRRVEA
jgi:hypothetical protein